LSEWSFSTLVCPIRRAFVVVVVVVVAGDEDDDDVCWNIEARGFDLCFFFLGLVFVCVTLTSRCFLRFDEVGSDDEEEDDGFFFF